MKGTDNFKKSIVDYLDGLALKDALFAKTLQKPNKNIDDCITYLLNYVKNSGCNGFTDDEIYIEAVHYFDEDDIEVGNPINCNVVVNHVVELTEEEKEAAKKDAHERLVKMQIDSITGKGKKHKRTEDNNAQPTLF